MQESHIGYIGLLILAICSSSLQSFNYPSRAIREYYWVCEYPNRGSFLW